MYIHYYKITIGGTGYILYSVLSTISTMFLFALINFKNQSSYFKKNTMNWINSGPDIAEEMSEHE
jgi:hypothetical protein